MQEITIKIDNNENIGQLSGIEIVRIRKIIEALIRSGGLTGVKYGQTIIHWDKTGEFMGIQLSYWPWRERY